MRWRGQGAIELIVILALIAVAGLIIYSSSQTTLAQSSKEVIISQARASVNDLATAASQVYSEGLGAKRMVYITIPEGAVSSRVYVNNNVINIEVNIDSNITDINTQTTMKLVQGADFPTTPGSYWVPVTAGPGYVLIGNSYLSINPSSLSFSMSPSASTNSTIVFTNLGSAPINVTLSPTWSYNGIVDLAVNNNVYSFILNSSGNGNNASVPVNLTTHPTTALQIYSGSIGVRTNTSETKNISLTVTVSGTQLPTGVSSILIETFKDSGYSTPTTNFTLPTNVNITGSGWTPSTSVTITILSPSGNPVKIDTFTPTSSSFTYVFNPAGLAPGIYTVTANQSSTSSTSSFTITACS